MWYSATMSRVTIMEIEQAIQEAKPDEQRQFLARLPHLILSTGDFALLKLAEPSFEFWNNKEDAVYDSL